MNGSLVSVVVATYKRDFSLKMALESLTKQTYENIEIVVVDDNDGKEWNCKVKQIISEFQENHPEHDVKCIVNHPNQGSANSRNIGIDASSGEYITFLDDDDIYLPEKVSSQLKAMVDFKADYSITDLFLYNENDVLIDKRIRNYIKRNDSDSLLKYHLKYHMTGTDTMMFKKNYLKEIGGFPLIDVGDEFYLMCNAINGKGSFCYLNRCDVKAYVHTGETGLSSGESKISGENALYEYKKNFFTSIDAKSRRYINMRHYAVLSFAYLRCHKYLNFLISGFKAVLISPIDGIKLLIGRKI